MKVQIGQLLEKVRELETHCSKLENNVKQLESKTKDLENTIKNLEKFKQNLIDTFKPLLSQNQIHAIGLKEKVARFESSEIVSALHIKYFSPRAYKFLYSFLPIPSIATLQRWASKIECIPGFQNFVFDLLKAKQINFDISEKLCVIIFDEIEISKKICYFQNRDKILGPFSKCQVVLLRG